MRVHYGKLRSTLVGSLTQELGATVEVVGDEAGMHVAVTLQNWCHDLEIAERAARQNLSLWPLSPSYLGTASRQGFILGFGGTTVAEIPNAVRKLRNLLAMN
jgi:GntR family transcriptional regulator/MocR family aminotransferase